MQRIAVCGAHGVGKSTLARSLSEALLLPRIDEVARTVAREFRFETTEQIQQADTFARAIYQSTVYWRQIAAEERHIDGFISDRSVFDIVAYMDFYDLPDRMIETYTEFAAEHSEKYDLLIYCPIPDVDIENDGFRLTDPEGQRNYDEILQGLLKQAKCEVFHLGRYRDSWISEALTFVNLRRKGVRVNG